MRNTRLSPHRNQTRIFYLLGLGQSLGFRLRLTLKLNMWLLLILSRRIPPFRKLSVRRGAASRRFGRVGPQEQLNTSYTAYSSLAEFQSQVQAESCLVSASTNYLLQVLNISNLDLVPGFYILAEVIMPSGQAVKPVIEDHHNGFVTVRYEPTSSGVHELHVKQNQQAIPGSPFFFYVDSINNDALTAYGPGLTRMGT